MLIREMLSYKCRFGSCHDLGRRDVALVDAIRGKMLVEVYLNLSRSQHGPLNFDT
jgi:hypothetical protein